MTYRVTDPDQVLEAWLGTEPSEQLRHTVQEWLFTLAEDPAAVGGVHAGGPPELPIYGRLIPGTNVVVLWSVFTAPPWPRELECVAIRHIETRPAQ